MQSGKSGSHPVPLGKESKAEIQASIGVEGASSETFKAMQRILMSCKIEKGSRLREFPTQFTPR